MEILSDYLRKIDIRVEEMQARDVELRTFQNNNIDFEHDGSSSITSNEGSRSRSSVSVIGGGIGNDFQLSQFSQMVFRNEIKCGYRSSN